MVIIIITIFITLIFFLLHKFVYINTNVKSKDVYKINDFKSIEPLHDELCLNFNILQKEVLGLLNNKTDTATEIFYGDVYSPEKKKILESLKNGNGWSVWGNERKDWFHYPISYNNNMLSHAKNNVPNLYKVVNSHKHKFHSVYISALIPHGSIDPHHDGDHVSQTLGKKILTYHFYFDAPPTSIIGVNGKEYEQKTGEYFIFDNTKTHWVKNKSDKWRIGIVGKFYI